MKFINIDEILNPLKAKLNNVVEKSSIDVNRICIDSRIIDEKSVFLPIVGDNFDGHQFIQKAFDKGIKLSFCSKNYYENHYETMKNLPLIIVEDTLTALQNLAGYVISSSNAKVVAITGSTGKTTTKDFIYEVLKQKYKVVKTSGNFNNHIGMPLTILGAEENTEIFILEMGMNHFGEIHNLAKIARPDYAVITNVGTSHIENLGSQEGILKAKMEIVDYFDGKGTLIVNNEDVLLNNLYKEPSRYKKINYGFGEEVDYKITDIKYDDYFQHNYKINKMDISLTVPGRHNVLNSANGVIVGKLFEVDDELIKKAIESYRGEKMRLNVVKNEKGIIIINDAYNASPDSMKSSLEMIKNIDGMRKVIFLGDMFEMGKHSIEGHRMVGDYVDIETTDLCITVGRFAIHIGERLIERGFEGENVFHVESYDEAARILNDYLKKGDVLLIKGSRGMMMEKILKKM
ncbi:MAG: UDP-N-acetylmuramoyl-tripeptide--D-alanyl-D-alanine ligase [Bacillota bacterium]|nr:UDP-N-acetylmuramoyl-tripeptide--D-alanyl-D-alanine ligase [Bacillota bacterium]